ncbi:MAG: hypothetical protein ACO2ZZ_01385 [Cyclobacteriaceae bacterium]
MKQTNLLLAFISFIAFSSCNEVNRVDRKLSGSTWDIVLIEGEGFYSGECGTPAGTFDEWSAMDAGRYEFSEEAGTFGVDLDAKSGVLVLSYEYTLNNRTITEEETMNFDWYFLDEFLVIHNPDEFYFRDYNIDDFDRSSWVLAHREGDGLGCSSLNTYHHIERR